MLLNCPHSCIWQNPAGNSCWQIVTALLEVKLEILIHWSKTLAEKSIIQHQFCWPLLAYFNLNGRITMNLAMSTKISWLLSITVEPLCWGFTSEFSIKLTALPKRSSTDRVYLFFNDHLKQLSKSIKIPRYGMKRAKGAPTKGCSGLKWTFQLSCISWHSPRHIDEATDIFYPRPEYSSPLAPTYARCCLVALSHCEIVKCG